MNKPKLKAVDQQPLPEIKRRLRAKREPSGVCKGETTGLMTYPPRFFLTFLNASVVRPRVPLSETLYPSILEKGDSNE